jgi:hypothetical protein
LKDAISSPSERVGFGARVSYNISPILAWEVEGDFFSTYSATGTQRGGREFLILGGPRAELHRHRVSFFLKPQPGLLGSSNVIRIQTSKLPSGGTLFNIFGGGHRNDLALDLGGGVELNTSRRTFLRFDVSEMLLRYADRLYGPSSGPQIAVPGVIGNSILVTAGLSRRIGPMRERVAEHPTNIPRWEVGSQFATLSLGRSKTVHTPLFIPDTLGDERGLGGRLTYNFNRWLAFDSAINYFFTSSRFEDS